MHEQTPHPGAQPQQLPIHRRATPLPDLLLDNITDTLEEGLYSQGLVTLSSCLTAGTTADHITTPTPPNPSQTPTQQEQQQAAPPPSQIPPPLFLALAATLAVHPSFTTRTTAEEKHAAARDALRYLRAVHGILGTRNAGLDRAFDFSRSASSAARDARGERARVRKRDYGQVSSSSSSTRRNDDLRLGQEETTAAIRCAYAGRQSLWAQPGVEDFWRVVGWGFNCSVKYPDRWARWGLWLGLMVEILEEDLNRRLAEDQGEEEQAGRNGKVQWTEKSETFTGGEKRRSAVEGSLLAKFLSSVGDMRNSQRRLMRAIFADGKTKSLAEFGEVWRNETKGPKVKAAEDGLAANKWPKLDLENGLFGDYFDHSASNSPASAKKPAPMSTSQQKSRAASAEQSNGRDIFSDDNDEDDEEEDGDEDEDEDDSMDDGTDRESPFKDAAISLPSVATYGGSKSLDLRRRLLSLLIAYSTTNPPNFADTDSLFDLLTEFLRPMPLPLFRAFVHDPTHLFPEHQRYQQHPRQHQPPLTGNVLYALLSRFLLQPLIVASVPRSRTGEGVTQQEFEQFFASCVANSTGAVDNAKVAVLVEGLLRNLWRQRRLVPEEGNAGGGGSPSRAVARELTPKEEEAGLHPEEDENRVGVSPSQRSAAELGLRQRREEEHDFRAGAENNGGVGSPSQRRAVARRPRLKREEEEDPEDGNGGGGSPPQRRAVARRLRLKREEGGSAPEHGNGGGVGGGESGFASLRRAVESGIKARREKVAGGLAAAKKKEKLKKNKKGKAGSLSSSSSLLKRLVEEDARATMELSAKTMGSIIGIVERKK